MSLAFRVTPYEWTALPTVNGGPLGLSVFYIGSDEQVVNIYDDDSVGMPAATPDEHDARWKCRATVESERIDYARWVRQP